MGKNDVLKVTGMRFYATHGLFPEENKLGQEFIIDVEALIDMTQMCLTDEISWNTSYAKIYQSAKEVTVGEEHKLIQRLAYRILEQVFDNTAAASAKVTVNKPGAPIKGVYDNAACTIERTREEME